jgi:hypothetical protein
MVEADSRRLALHELDVEIPAARDGYASRVASFRIAPGHRGVDDQGTDCFPRRVLGDGARRGRELPATRYRAATRRASGAHWPRARAASSLSSRRRATAGIIVGVVTLTGLG